MTPGKKIILGIIAVIVGFLVVSVIVVGIWQTVDPEGYDTYQDQREAERKAEELQAKQDSGTFLRAAWDIDLSKMSNGDYKDKAESVLSNHILKYQGKDGSGKNMQDAIIDFYDCSSDADFEVEILRWNDEMIVAELHPDFVNCDKISNFLFGYKPDTNDLRYIIDQTWKEQAKSVMNYLDINP